MRQILSSITRPIVSNYLTTDTAEQARIIQLLIERVDIGTNGLKLRFRDKGLAHMVAEVGIMTGKGQKAA
jgi:hypothetical protein